LITGAAKRIGKALALDLAARGVHIAAHYNQSEYEMYELIDLIKGAGVKVSALQANLENPAETESLFDDACQLTGSIDILINNASIFGESKVTDFSLDELNFNIRINSFAPLLLCRRLAKQAGETAIINMLDTRILDYDSKHAAYHMSKRMLFDLTRMMALEFAPRVRVNAVAPGVILPPNGKDDSYFTEMVRTNPLQNHGDVEDITSAVAFLLESRFITGQVIYVDGGRHMRGMMYGG